MHRGATRRDGRNPMCRSGGAARRTALDGIDRRRRRAYSMCSRPHALLYAPGHARTDSRPVHGATGSWGPHTSPRRPYEPTPAPGSPPMPHFPAATAPNLTYASGLTFHLPLPKKGSKVLKTNTILSYHLTVLGGSSPLLPDTQTGSGVSKGRVVSCPSTHPDCIF